MKQVKDLKNYLIPRTYEVLSRAETFSKNLKLKVSECIENYIKQNQLDRATLCFIVVGSLGRTEALEASDIDLIPIVSDGNIESFKSHDSKIRDKITKELKIKVSNGHDLTECTEVRALIELESIGGEKDNSSQLTKRILILTEGDQVGGGYSIIELKRKILEAYGKNLTTSGRHILTLCNDIARYYRTLFIEYKAKVDVTNKDWCTRNAKLRHSRKVWYFSSLISIVAKATDNPSDYTKFNQELLNMFSLPPILRLLNSLDKNHYYTIGKLLEHYAWFLNLMSTQINRDNLAKIKYEERYSPENTLYYSVKLNSDLVHISVCKIINDLDPNPRQKIIDWFLL